MSYTKTLFKQAWRFVERNSQVILAGVSMVSTVGAVVLSAEATPKAMQIICDEEWQRHELLEPKEKIKLTWKCYIPAGVLTLLSCACMLGGTKIGLGKQAELMSMVAAGENLYERYRKRVQEALGKDEENQIQALMAQEQLESRPEVVRQDAGGGLIIPASLGIYDTGDGDELILEAWTGKLIRSSEQALMNHCAAFNQLCSNAPATFFPITDWYYEANMPVPQGAHIVGYSSEYRMSGVRFEWDSPAHVYKIMTYENNPKAEFNLGTYR